MAPHPGRPRADMVGRYLRSRGNVGLRRALGAEGWRQERTRSGQATTRGSVRAERRRQLAGRGRLSGALRVDLPGLLDQSLDEAILGDLLDHLALHHEEPLSLAG